MQEIILDWLLQMKSFPVSVTLDFSIQRTLWSWIGESLSQISPGLQSDFFSLLQSTLLSDLRAADHPILKFTQDRRAFRLLLMVGVIIGVVAGSEIGSSNVNPNQIEDLRIASVVIFLVLTVVQAVQTCILATSSVSGMLKISTTTYSSPLRNGVTNIYFL